MIQISIIEDHKDFRTGLEQLLSVNQKFKCLKSFANAENAIDELSGNEDLMLLDINLPGMSGIEAIPIIKKQYPHIKILMLSMLDNDNTILEAILAGADGYLVKKSTPTQLLTAIEECYNGGSPMSPGIAKKVLTLFKQYIPQKNSDYNLTKRETEILNHLVNGQANKAIADSLFISLETVRNHIRHIYQKLQVHSKSQAVVKAIKEGLV